MADEIRTVEPQETQRDPRTMESEQLDIFYSQGQGPEQEAQQPEPSEGQDREKTDDARETQPEVKAEPETPDHRAELEKLKPEWEKLSRRVKDQENFIGHLSREMALLRGTQPEDEAAEIQEINDLFTTGNAVEGQRRLRQLENKRMERFRTQQEVQQQEMTRQNRDIIGHRMPDFENYIEDIAKLILEDSQQPEWAEGFRKDPYRLEPTLAYNLHVRAKLIKEVETMKSELERLRTENEQLRKRPDEVLRNIESASRSRPMTAAASGGVQSGGSYKITKLPHQMTAEELRQFQ